MSTEILGIFRGQIFATAEGDELTVVDIVPKSGYAIIDNLQEERGVMALGAMLEAIQSGALVNVSEHSEDSKSRG